MELVFESGYDNTKNKSLFVRTIQANFLFDCNYEFFDRFNENLNGVIISSKDNMTGINRLRSWVNNHDVDKMPVYLEKDTLIELSKQYGSEFINSVIIEPGKPFRLIGTNLEVIPFKMGDSLGFRFNNIVYGKNGEIKPNSEKYVYSARVMFLTSDIKDSLGMAKKYRPQVCVFSKEDQTDAQIKLSWKLMSGYRGTELIIAKNNSMLEIGRTLTQNLMESKKAMSISSEKCIDIIKGNKSIIILDKLEKERSGTFTYLIDNDKCYGVVKLGTPYKINILDFKNIKSEHLISDEERKKWWPNKEILFAYPFELIDSFNIPRQVILNDKNEITEFMSSVQTKPEDDPLWGDVKLFDQLSDAKIIKDFICVSGSYIAKREDHVPNDVDIIIKMKDPPEYLKRSTEVRVGKMFKYPEKLHFVWDDSASPFDSFIPLYDLKLERIKEAKMVKMSEDIIIPMKPSKKFYDLDELEKNVEDNKKYAVEKKYDGFRAVFIKSGSRTKLYTEQGKEITNVFPTIVSQATDITGKDVILDGELVIKGGSRSEMAKFIDKIKKNEQGDDSGVVYEVFDCIKLGDKDLTDQPWFVRKANVHNLSFKGNIKEVDSIVVSSKSELIKAVELVRKLDQSEGAMVKDYEGNYTLNGESEDWIKFRNRDDLIVKIIKVTETENGFTYTVGVPVSEEAKINEKHLINGTLQLGNTFVTKDVFKENDKVKVSVEEVWRHEYSDKTISYSIHKPSLIGISELEYSTIKDLDDLVVSKGELVVEQLEGATTTSSPGISSIQGTQIKGPKGEKWPIEVEDYFNQELSASNITNHDFFDTWTPESAYFLGLLSTDGNLDNNTNRIEFYMSKEDGGILNDLAKLLGDPIGPKEISGYMAYRFKSKHMADRLRSLGMDVRKKERETFKYVPSEVKLDFARGSFDADGSITEDRIQYDNEDKPLINWMVKLFETISNDVKHYEYGNMGKIVVMHAEAVKILNKLYFRKPYFDRKKSKSVTNSEISIENFVVKRGDNYCVIHGHPQNPDSKTDQPEGSIIKCFPTKSQADAMHKAIIISKIKRGTMSDSEYCINCKSKCCKFFAIPIDQKENMETGIPISIFGELEQNLVDYFKLHEGVEVIGDLVKISKALKTSEQDTKFGKLIIIHSKCNALAGDGSCNIYETRPEACRNYCEENASACLFPVGCKYLAEESEGVKLDEEGDTRSEAADSFWKSNWQNSYPAKGGGKFVLHNHFRGLTEEESKLSNEELLDTDNSIHSDLRLEKDNKSLYGITVFTGEAKDNKSHGGNKLIYMAKNKGEKSIEDLQGAFKLEQPHNWLGVDNYVSDPGEPGATANAFAKFFISDSGTYTAGTWREHMMEFFINGKEMKGRMVMMFAPVGGLRKWLIDFPIDQTPYSETHNKEDIISELKSKGQNWLFWKEKDNPVERIEIQ